MFLSILFGGCINLSTISKRSNLLFRAHSFILAAGSEYFKQVLEALHPWQAPVLLLPQTPFNLLQVQLALLLNVSPTFKPKFPEIVGVSLHRKCESKRAAGDLKTRSSKNSTSPPLLA